MCLCPVAQNEARYNAMIEQLNLSDTQFPFCVRSTDLCDEPLSSECGSLPSASDVATLSLTESSFLPCVKSQRKSCTVAEAYPLIMHKCQAILAQENDLSSKLSLSCFSV